MNKASTVIYLNDKRKPPQPLLNRVVFHIKQILRLLLNSVFNRKEDEKKKFKGVIHVAGEGSEYNFSSLIVYEAISDYDIQTSKQVLLYSDISSDNPVCILSTNYPTRTNKVKFSLCLFKQRKWIKSISIKGYIHHNIKEHFTLNISEEISENLSWNAYWLDIILDLRGFNIKNHTKRVEIYLSDVGIESMTNHKIIMPFYAISPDIPSDQISEKQRPVFILSFDGITTEDIFQSKDVYRSISSFADENYWFENAITSSAVTASSAASLITGLNLARHFIYIYSKRYLSPDLKTISHNIKTLGEKVRSIGMHSYGLFAFGKWSPQYGYARGFSDYRCITTGDLSRYSWLDESIKKISNNIEAPCLFAIHHLGGHPPFLPVITTPYFDLEHSFYHNNLTVVDNFFGILMNYLKRNDLYSDALIVFVSDHGRSLSGLKSKEFHFLENRLRVPLIIKNPDWDTNSLNEYNVSSHVSAQTIIHEIVSDFLGITSSGNQDLAYRTVDGITWVSETVDYRRMDCWHGDPKEGYIGLVGYDDEFKYTLYFGINFKLFLLKESSNLLRYQMNKSGIVEDNAHGLSSTENKRVVDSAFEYLNSGLSFAKRNQPEKLGSRTSMIDI